MSKNKEPDWLLIAFILSFLLLFVFGYIEIYSIFNELETIGTIAFMGLMFFGISSFWGLVFLCDR